MVLFQEVVGSPAHQVLKRQSLEEQGQCQLTYCGPLDARHYRYWTASASPTPSTPYTPPIPATDFGPVFLSSAVSHVESYKIV